MPVIRNTASRYVYGLGTTIYSACHMVKTTAEDAARDINGGETLVATVLQYSADRYVVMVAGVMSDRAFYVDAVSTRAVHGHVAAVADLETPRDGIDLAGA